MDREAVLYLCDLHGPLLVLCVKIFSGISHRSIFSRIFHSPEPKARSPIPMSSIRSLKPNVTRDDVIRQFSGGGPSAALRNVLYGRLHSVAELYIPFRLFRVQITNRGVFEEKLMALDAVTGTLDLFQFDHIPNGTETITVDTRNCPSSVLADSLLTDRVLAKLRRILYSNGFFKMRDLQLSAVPLPDELHIPYWIGFRGSENHVRLFVIDAVRRRTEGAKVRRLVEEWLAQKSESGK